MQQIEEKRTPLFEFQVQELKMGHPITNNRFWIEQLIEIEEVGYYSPWWAFGLAFRKKPVTKKVWEIFHDPASSEANTGYKTLLEANYVIDRYLFNMTPIVHKYARR